MKFRFPWRMSKTVTVPTWRDGRLTMPEPAWCAGEHAQHPQHPADFRHEGVDVPLIVHAGGRTFETLPVAVVQEPFADGDPLPHVSINLGDDYARFTRAELLAFADGLDRHADYLRSFADEVEELRTAVAKTYRPAGLPADWPCPAPPVDEDGEP